MADFGPRRVISPCKMDFFFTRVNFQKLMQKMSERKMIHAGIYPNKTNKMQLFFQALPYADKLYKFFNSTKLLSSTSIMPR